MARYNRYPPTRRRPLEDTSSRLSRQEIDYVDSPALKYDPRDPADQAFIELGRRISGDPNMPAHEAYYLGTQRGKIGPTHQTAPPTDKWGWFVHGDQRFGDVSKTLEFGGEDYKNLGDTSYVKPPLKGPEGPFRQPRHALDQLEYEDQLLAAQKKANRLAADEFMNMSVMSPEESAIAQRTAGLTPTGIPNKELAVRGLADLPRGGRDRQRPPPYARDTPWTAEDLAHLDTVQMQREQQAVEQMMAQQDAQQFNSLMSSPADYAGINRMARSGPEHVAMGFSPDYLASSNPPVPVSKMDPKILKRVQNKQNYFGTVDAFAKAATPPPPQDPSIWSAYTKEGWQSGLTPMEGYGMGLAANFIPTHDQPRIYEGGGSWGGIGKGAATGYSIGGPYGAVAGAGIGLLGGFDTTSPPLKREITWSRGGSIPMPSTSSASYYQSLLG